MVTSFTSATTPKITPAFARKTSNTTYKSPDPGKNRCVVNAHPVFINTASQLPLLAKRP